MEFSPLINAHRAPGLAILVEPTEDRYLRITHVFDDCMYVMWVSTPEAARSARRPIRKTIKEFDDLISTGAMLGQLTLPPSMSTPPPLGSPRAEAVDSGWRLIRPLVETLACEENLSRSQFSASIRAEAEKNGMSFAPLCRLLLRYYYFGCTKLALMKLPSGTKPGKARYVSGDLKKSDDSKPRRRGRKSALAHELGANDFVLTDKDISDIVKSYRTLLRKGPTNRSLAHEKYLATAFRLRHPTIYSQYLEGQRIEPVTARQFSYYLDRHAELGGDLVGNARDYRRNQGHLGALYANGPGEVYEIDSTEGRIFLVTAGEQPVLVGKPTIYLLVDRWSRFVVSVYMSLKSPSYEEVRHALLIAFTSRDRRFGALGVDIDDERWPVGHMPAVICPDRGSEFMSNSMEQSVVEELRIELTPLPPYCPDGKAIVERLIRKVKRRMSGTGMTGTFADRPLDPESKRAARGARTAAFHTLGEAYRSVIEIIHDHNNRPHTALRKMRVLTQAGVAPTPTAAYLWGLQNIKGLRKGTFSDNDYQRLLLATDSGSIASGVLRYRGRPYSPVNEPAIEISRTSSTRSKEVSVRVDKTDPHEVFMVTSQGVWARFSITGGGANDIAGITLDEEENLESHTSLLWAKSDHASRIDRVSALGVQSKTSTKRAPYIEPASIQALHDAKAEETNIVKRVMTQKTKISPPNRAVVNKSSQNDEVNKILAQEVEKRLAAVRRHKGKR